MKIDIITDDLQILTEIFGENDVVEEVPFESINGARLRYQGIEDKGIIEGLEGLNKLVFILEYVDDVAVGLFSAFLYDVLKNRSKSLIINGMTTKIEKAKIEERIRGESNTFSSKK